MALSKGGKVVVGILAGVCTLGAGFVVAYKVSDNFKSVVDNTWNKITNKFKSEEKKNEERKDQIKEDERLEDFDDEKKDEIVAKFDKITESDEYKDMTDDEKNELVDKLIESEKLQQDVQKEQEEYESKKEENKQQLESLTNSQQELEQKVQDLKESGASDEEIKAAEEEQQKVEEQIKAAEQEKIYYETVDTVKDATSTNPVFNDRNPGTSIRKIHGIYKFGGSVYIFADITTTEVIGGVDIISTQNALCSVSTLIRGDETYDVILNRINTANVIKIKNVCTNKNAESHKEYFEQNKYSMNSIFSEFEQIQWSINIVESWETEGRPEFIIQLQNKDGEEMEYDIVQFNSSTGRYSCQIIQKICPEFWAQVEAEQAQQKQQEQTPQEQALNETGKYTTTDSNGEQGFDWNAYQQDQAAKTQQTQTSKDTSNPSLYDLDMTR